MKTKLRRGCDVWHMVGFWFRDRAWYRTVYRTSVKFATRIHVGVGFRRRIEEPTDAIPIPRIDNIAPSRLVVGRGESIRG